MSITSKVKDLSFGENPWELLNPVDFILIGLMSILFFQMVQILSMGWHRYTLWRVTGSANSPMPNPAQPLTTKEYK
jgi:hypothetical protein